MTIKDASLEIIATRRSQYPEDGRPEFLLVGRSNVVKVVLLMLFYHEKI